MVSYGSRYLRNQRTGVGKFSFSNPVAVVINVGWHWMFVSPNFAFVPLSLCWSEFDILREAKIQSS